MFNTYRNNPKDNNSLGYNVVTAIAEDEKGNLWIGTDGGSLDRFDRKNQKFTQLWLLNELLFFKQMFINLSIPSIFTCFKTWSYILFLNIYR